MTKKIERQRRKITLIVERRQIKIVQCLPLAIIELVAMLDLAFGTGARGASAFAADVLALLVTERAEEFVEIAPALVAPVELPVEARQPIGARERFQVRRLREIEMHR